MSLEYILSPRNTFATPTLYINNNRKYVYDGFCKIHLIVLLNGATSFGSEFDNNNTHKHREQLRGSVHLEIL